MQLSIRSCSCNGVRLTRHTDNLTYRNLLTLNKRATVSLIFTGCFTLVLIQFKCCSTHALLQCFGSVTLISCSIHGLQNIAFPSIATELCPALATVRFACVQEVPFRISTLGKTLFEPQPAKPPAAIVKPLISVIVW